LAYAAQPKPAARTASPEEQVKRAQIAFEDQDYERAIALTKVAAENTNLAPAVRLNAQRILSFSYITLSRTTEAEATVRAIFAANESFDLAETESPKFRGFFRDVRARMAKEKAERARPAVPPVVHVTLKHTPPAQVEPGTHVDLSVRVEGATQAPSRVVLHVRDASDRDFEEIDLDVDQTSARGNVPASAVRGTVLEYYFVALDERQRVMGEGRDREAPYRIPIASSSRSWLLPVVIGGSVLAIGAVFGGLALAGVFDKSTAARNSTVTVTVTE